MQPLIDYVRRHGAAATDDEFFGVTYWTDEQLQDILDSISSWSAVKLVQVSNTIYKPDMRNNFWIESDTIRLLDTKLNELDTSFTYTPGLNELTIAQEGDYVILARMFNMWEALADLWLRKAEQRFDSINFKAGNNKMNLEEEYEHCIKNYELYRRRIIRRYKK